MNKNKLIYEAPEAELLVVRFEEGLLNLSNGVNYANQAGGAGGEDDYVDGEEF